MEDDLVEQPTASQDTRQDEEARYYLDVLQRGAESEKIAARNGLAYIFERRGMLEEVVELYEANVRAGVRDPRLYERLAAAYRRLGRDDLAAAARETAANFGASVDGVDDSEQVARGGEVRRLEQMIALLQDTNDELRDELQARRREIQQLHLLLRLALGQAPTPEEGDAGDLFGRVLAANEANVTGGSGSGPASSWWRRLWQRINA